MATKRKIRKRSRVKKRKEAWQIAFDKVLDALWERDYEIAYIAEQAGVAPSTLRNWMIGATYAPRLVTIGKVLPVLGLTISVE